MNNISYERILIAQIKTTCFEFDETLKTKDVIEIGTCILDTTTLQTRELFSAIVKSNKEVTEYCTKKTGLTPEDIASGVSFSEIIDYISDTLDSYSTPWASYGSFAPSVIKRQCNELNLSYPFNDRFINIKSLFPLIFNLKHEVSLKEAMKKLKLQIPDRQDAEDEVLNAAIVFKECLRGPCVLEGKFNKVVEVKRSKK